ncbi:MAG: 5'-nucleotidase/UDP-sugar diphosphatase [Patiriisocius sp.]|jgi:5'-nucleotidase/UDP-sugar diphosphatase
MDLLKRTSFLNVLGIITFSFILITCSRGKAAVVSEDVNEKGDEKIEVVIMQVNDVYEISPLEGGKAGGLARVERLHQELLEKNNNTLLVHGGDFLNPSLMGTLKQNGERVKGKQMIEMMNYMSFDLVAFGNHEFDLDYEDLQKRLNESTFQWIGTNILHVDGDEKRPFYTEKQGEKELIPPTYIFNLTDEDGTTFNLGFISATINSNPKDYVQYRDPYESAKIAYSQVLPKSDLVLGLTHLKLSQDKLLSGTLPEIPLMIGGHEHENMNITVGTSRITKADANAKSVYLHYINHDKKTKVTTIDSKLIIIDDSREEDEGAAKIAKKWADFQSEQLGEVVENPDEVIFHSEVKLDGRDKPIRSTQTNLGMIIAESMAKAYNVDAAFVNGGSIRFDDQLEGDITGIDIFRALPYGGAVLKLKIKGDLLSKVLQEGKLRSGTGGYLQRYNFTKNDGWEIKGEKIDSVKIYEIAISDYLILGRDIPILKESNPGILEVYRPEKGELTEDIRRVVIEFLKGRE